jgi:hypothetical protein
VEPSSIEARLGAADAAVEAGRSLAGTGFWAAVEEVKREPALASQYADRIAGIDQRAFADWPLVVIPIGLGTVLALIATGVGLALVGLSYLADSSPTDIVLFYLGLVVLLGSTHGLGHLLVGRIVGIRFTHWFVAQVSRPQPGVKVDYATYLRTPARSRAWMHASGAITTKLIPFLLIGAAVAAGLPAWAVWALPVLGVAMIITDIAWSTKASDWRKFRREMGLAQDS